MPAEYPVCLTRIVQFSLALTLGTLAASKSVGQLGDEKADDNASTKSGLEALIGSEHAWRIVSVILALSLLLTIIAIILLVCVVMCMAKEARDKNRDYRYNRGYTR